VIGRHLGRHGDLMRCTAAEVRERGRCHPLQGHRTFLESQGKNWRSSWSWWSSTCLSNAAQKHFSVPSCHACAGAAPRPGALKAQRLPGWRRASLTRPRAAHTVNALPLPVARVSTSSAALRSVMSSRRALCA
jgi:hypothetical protein